MSQHTNKGETSRSQPASLSSTSAASVQTASDADDLSVVMRAKAGEREAFGLLVQRHGKAVLNLIGKMIRDRNIVEDLWQETFVRALENLHTYEPRTHRK